MTNKQNLTQIYNPEIVYHLVKCFKDLGLTDKQIIKGIHETQKQILKEVMIEHVQKTADSIIINLHKGN